MPYTEEMTTSEILLRLASMRNELLQAVNDIEKISKNICYKAEQTENSSEKPNNCEPKICDTCRYYNSNIPCGSTPSACKEADKFAEEFVDGLKKLKPKVEPQTEYDKYREKIKAHDPHKYGFEDEPQTERSE